MGCTKEAIDVFEGSRVKAVATSSTPCFYAPGKAANAGGVAVSGLEMAQNSQRIQWSSEEVDQYLVKIMANCFDTCLKTALEYAEQKPGVLPSLVTGANIAGYVKVAEAMEDLGDVW